jgi:uncharacterized membrane protein
MTDNNDHQAMIETAKRLAMTEGAIAGGAIGVVMGGLFLGWLGGVVGLVLGAIVGAYKGSKKDLTHREVVIRLFIPAITLR